MTKYRAATLGAIGKIQRADQAVEQSPQAAAVLDEPQGRFGLILPPAPQKWTHTNPRSEIVTKPRRNGVIWHR
jgi:hypothetical protein